MSPTIPKSVRSVSIFTFFSANPRQWTFPVYNMETDTGVTATLGFKALILTQILPISVRPQDSGLTVTSPSIDDLGEIHNVSVTIWGVPAATSHDARTRRRMRAAWCGEMHQRWGGRSISRSSPSSRNPTSCTGVPLKTTMKSDSWEEEENWSEETTEIAAMEEAANAIPSTRRSNSSRPPKLPKPRPASTPR